MTMTLVTPFLENYTSPSISLFLTFSGLAYVKLCLIRFIKALALNTVIIHFFCMFKEVVLVELLHRKQNTLVVLTEMF